jgi:hypothetical protein
MLQHGYDFAPRCQTFRLRGRALSPTRSTLQNEQQANWNSRESRYRFSSCAGFERRECWPNHPSERWHTGLAGIAKSERVTSWPTTRKTERIEIILLRRRRRNITRESPTPASVQLPSVGQDSGLKTSARPEEPPILTRGRDRASILRPRSLLRTGAGESTLCMPLRSCS